MMGILGSEIITQMHAGSPLASDTLFGIYLGVAMWGALILRDPRIRRVFPITRG
jgi:hypothetical protein